MPPASLTAKTSSGATVTDPSALTATYTTGDGTFDSWYLVGCTFDGTTLTLYKYGSTLSNGGGPVGTATGTAASGAMTLYVGDKAGNAIS